MPPRGMREPEMVQIASWIAEAVTYTKDDSVLNRIQHELREFCASYPALGLAN